MRLNITDTLLRGLKPPVKGKRLILQDDLVPKLFLRVTATGVCTWSVLGYLPNGKRVRPTLGQWPALGISKARKQAEITAGEISKGIDPTERKRQSRREREASERAPTVADRLGEWQAARQADWSERYRDEVARLTAKLIEPKLGKHVLAATTRDDWTGLIAGVRKKTPATAAWLYSTVSSFLGFAEAHGWVPVNVLPRRAKNLIAPAVASRERILTDDELTRVWLGAQNLTPKTRAFTRLLIMTAARVDEVANLPLGELDCGAGRWRLPGGDRTKNRLPLMLPLHPLLLTELEAVWPDAGAGAEYQLLGSVKGSGFQSPSKLKRRIDKLSGVTNWRWHDLRRTARSGMSRLGVDSRAAEAAINHVSDRSKLQRTYDRYDYQAEAIAALQRWQAHVAGLLAAAEAELTTVADVAA